MAKPMEFLPKRETDDAQFVGISRQSCPIECGLEFCLITGVGRCGHPCKGGIQAADQSLPDVVRRYNQSRKILAIDEVVKSAQ